MYVFVGMRFVLVAAVNFVLAQSWLPNMSVR